MVKNEWLIRIFLHKKKSSQIRKLFILVKPHMTKVVCFHTPISRKYELIDYRYSLYSDASGRSLKFSI